MNRVRPVEALLAALATLAVTLPLTTLFTPLTWFRPSVILVAVVALVGMGLRRITAKRPLVVVGQLVLLVNAASLMHGRGHLLGGLLPTAISMVSDYAPRARAALTIGLLMTAHHVGCILSAYVALWIVEPLGWRAAFWVCVVPLLFVPVLARFLPESLSFLVARGRPALVRFVLFSEGAYGAFARVLESLVR